MQIRNISSSAFTIKKEMFCLHFSFCQWNWNKFIQELSLEKATAIDPIHPNLRKLVIDVLTLLLTKLIDLSKSAPVVPVDKENLNRN